MTASCLVRAAMVAVVITTPLAGQTVRPEHVPYMSLVSRIKETGMVNPRYSRDGRWLAFDARESGTNRQHIFVMPANGGAAHAMTSGDHNDMMPMWTAEGDRLVFISKQPNAVMTIGVDPATGRAVGEVKRVTLDSIFPMRGFDVAPDAKSVAYVTPTGPNKFDLRVVPITGGPARTLASVEGGADVPRFDRTGEHVYFVVTHLEGAPKKGSRARDIRRIAVAGGEASTTLTIPEGLMGLQIDPISNRVVVRDGDRAVVLTLTGDSVATVAWAEGMATVGHLGFTPDGNSMVTPVDATRLSIHVIPLDGGPIRSVTDSSGSPWPDYWLGDQIFISGDTRVDRDDALSMDGKVTAITPDFRKANDGVSLKNVGSDPFADGIHHAVRAASASGDTSLFVYNARTGELRRVGQSVLSPRALGVNGEVDAYSQRYGDGFLYRSLKNGVVEIHLVDVSARDHLLLSVGPLPKEPEGYAFAPGRSTHAYQRGDTAILDVTIGAAKPVRVLVRPGSRIRDVVFNGDGSSLFADVITAQGQQAGTRGAFFSTSDLRALSLPARWLETAGVCWHPTWLPDHSGVVVFCNDPTAAHSWVSRLPAKGPATPQPLTRRETAHFWDYTLSPDGKYVAVPAESNPGTMLWRIDLRAASQLAQAKR